MIESIRHLERYGEKEFISVVVNEAVLIAWNPETGEAMYHVSEDTDSDTAKELVSEFFAELRTEIDNERKTR